MTALITRLPTLQTGTRNHLRNIGIAAHIDAGKTTLTERILYFAGAIHRCGDVHDGNTTTDFSDIEKQKGITISAAAVPCTWSPAEETGRHKLLAGQRCSINLIDTPGHVDFTAEVERSLRVLDGAVAVFCGVAGVQPQSETVWRQADRYQVPRLAFVNKMDRAGADFHRVVTDLNEKLGANAWPILLPLGRESDLRGQLDVINRKALFFGQTASGGYTIAEIPADCRSLVESTREELIRRLAEIDDEIASSWLEGESPDTESLLAAIRRQTLLGRFVPVIGGSAYKYVGVQPLIDAVVQFLPAPEDIPTVQTTTETGALPETIETGAGPLVALAFKLVTDKLAGRLVFVRVYRGTLRKGEPAWNPRTRRSERIGRLVRVIADKREEISEAAAGEICAIVGLRGFTTGDTLCDPGHALMLEPPTFPEPVVSMSLEPASSSDPQRLAEALAVLCDEDPTFRTYTHPETSQCIIAGMGELHLEVIRQKLESEHRVTTRAGAPEIAYRETVTASSHANYLLKKQSGGGAGMYARVVLDIEPSERGTGLVIESCVKGGNIPSHFIGAVERGIAEAAQTGVLAGYPVVDATVRIVDGAAHVKDSNEMAFRLAAAEAFREAVRSAQPALLEPLMQIECSVPAIHQGDIVGDINRRRGKVTGIDQRAGVGIVTAEVPLAEMFGYANAIRSLSRGRASYTMTPLRFEELPASLGEAISKDRRS